MFIGFEIILTLNTRNITYKITPKAKGITRIRAHVKKQNQGTPDFDNACG
jgi:hypothetical protein